jgi:hypothetical protein
VGITRLAGEPDWDAAFIEAMNSWSTTTDFTFSLASTNNVDPCDNATSPPPAPRNGVDFAPTDYGVGFNDAIAIEHSRFSGNQMLHSGIVFDSTESWDMYNEDCFCPAIDFRRVAVHELGHTLGLAHENILPAVMSPAADDDETPTADDINGAQFHYGDNDTDTIRNNLDNCRDNANTDQEDADGDGQGDVCDNDADNDTLVNASDNCPLVANLNQSDLDMDGDGDACDIDNFNDGIIDTPVVDQQQAAETASGFFVDSDNNYAQTVTAGRPGFVAQVELSLFCSVGGVFRVEIQTLNGSQPSGTVLAATSVATSEISGGASFRSFVFPTPVVFPAGGQFAFVASSSVSCGITEGPSGSSYPGGQEFFSNNGGGNWFGQGIDLAFKTLVPLDNCPLAFNPGQGDIDADGAGNECDDDTDGDGTVNTVDLDDDNDGTPDTADDLPLNPDETVDTDNDGLGNNADPDDDNDGTLDGPDAFPLDASEQSDFDNDDTGDNADLDDDNDTLPDAYELANNLNPFNAADAALDADSDGLTNLEEFQGGSDPQDPNSPGQGNAYMPWLPILILEEP